MSNPSKRIGTYAETKVARFFTLHGLPTERKALAGSADNGDLRTTMPDGTEVTVEVKAGRQTANYPRSRFDDWKRQTLVEGANSGCPPMLVIVRHNRMFSRNTEIWLPNQYWNDGNTFSDGWTMMHVDDFIKAVTGKFSEDMIGE